MSLCVCPLHFLSNLQLWGLVSHLSFSKSYLLQLSCLLAWPPSHRQEFQFKPSSCCSDLEKIWGVLSVFLSCSYSILWEFIASSLCFPRLIAQQELEEGHSIHYGGCAVCSDPSQKLLEKSGTCQSSLHEVAGVGILGSCLGNSMFLNWVVMGSVSSIPCWKPHGLCKSKLITLPQIRFSAGSCCSIFSHPQPL